MIHVLARRLRGLGGSPCAAGRRLDVKPGQLSDDAGAVAVPEVQGLGLHKTKKGEKYLMIEKINRPRKPGVCLFVGSFLILAPALASEARAESFGGRSIAASVRLPLLGSGFLRVADTGDGPEQANFGCQEFVGISGRIGHVERQESGAYQ